MPQQAAQIEQFLVGHPDRWKPFLHQQLQNQLGIASIMFLLAGFRGTNLCGIPLLGIRSLILPAGSETTASVQSLRCPPAPGVEAGYKTPALLAFVQQRAIHDFSGHRVEHRQRLLASV